MEGLAVDITVAAVLGLAAEVTKRVQRRLVVDATEYAVIGLAVETTAPKLTADAIE